MANLLGRAFHSRGPTAANEFSSRVWFVDVLVLLIPGTKACRLMVDGIQHLPHWGMLYSQFSLHWGMIYTELGHALFRIFEICNRIYLSLRRCSDINCNCNAFNRFQ